MLFYQFSEETGSREDCSIFYSDNLLVDTPAQNKNSVEVIIGTQIGLTKQGRYDTEFDRNHLVSQLNAAGFPARFIDADEFFIHED